ncbi:MAG: T9SS type A sorting domain-containing protein, partial [bacterium]
MKRFIFLTIAVGFFITSLYTQNIELTFTAIDNSQWVQLDSIKLMNRSQGGDTVLYWPDTVLSYPVGIAETFKKESAFRILQNYPNPVTEQTTISLFVPEQDNVELVVSDMLGRVILVSKRDLNRG